MFNASNVIEVIEKYFSNTAYLVLFCASVLYLFFTGTKGRKRGFIAAALVFILLINDFAYKKFINYDGGITYYRHLWVIPYVTIIALAITDLCKRLPRLIYRGAIVIAACIIVFSSEVVNPFLYYWNIPLNPKMVSEDISKLGDALEQIRKETNKRLYVVAPNEIREALWLYNGEINVSGLLISEEEKYENVIAKGCAEGKDYVILPKASINELSPAFETNEYALYHCEGYPGYRRKVDSQWRTIRISYYDNNNNPIICPKGYCEIAYSYYQIGNEVKEISFYNEEGEPLLTPYGYASVERDYNSSKMVVSEKYYDEQGIIIGQVDESGSKKPGMLFFVDDCTDGITIHDGGSIKMQTNVQDNSFNAVCFQLLDAITGKYILSFGVERKEGFHTGKYIHNLNGGLYYLRFKGNSNLTDEYFESLEYIEEGEIIRYSYVIKELKEKTIVIDELKINSLTENQL